MALTLTVLSRRGEQARSLTFDAPRIVIGRSDGCELRVPDATVSPRHASIRSRGAEYLLFDENSKNGTSVGRAPLLPLSPRVLRSGDRIRVGRVWIEVGLGPATAPSATRAAAKALAVAMIADEFAARGEPTAPQVLITEGPDRDKTLALTDVGKQYVFGRALECSLALTDPDASRRHVGVTAKGDKIVVQDLGSKAGALIEGAQLSTTETLWRPGQVVSFGRTRLLLEDPIAEALAELERAPEEILSPGEVASMTPPGETPDAPPPDASPSGGAESALVATPTPTSSDLADTSEPLPRRNVRPKKASGGWGITDAAVVLLALGVLVLSVAGWWLLSK